MYVSIILAAFSGWGIRKAASELLRERKRERRAQRLRREAAQRAADRERREAAWETIKRTKPNEETRIVPVVSG